MKNLFRSGVRKLLVSTALVFVMPAFSSCSSTNQQLAAPQQTFAELRAIRGKVTIAQPGEKTHTVLPHQRVNDGAQVTLAEQALAWLIDDRGVSMLIKGPAKLTYGINALNVQQGRVFVDSAINQKVTIQTPSDRFHISRTKASIDVPNQKQTQIYVLLGEVRPSTAMFSKSGSTGQPLAAKAGQMLTVSGTGNSAKAAITQQIAWHDWTGGLAAAQEPTAPPPFGVGMVAARLPGEQGTPRLPLAIRSMDVKVAIEGDLAVTQVEQLFFNGSSQTVEGMYLFRTPPDAVLNRFGVDRGGVIVWGHVKEKKAALEQYKSHVYTGSTEDPALLEWDGQGVYQARLYPIQPGTTRKVVVRYSQWLERSGDTSGRKVRRVYVFPMAAQGAEKALPRIEFFGANIDIKNAGATEVRSAMGGRIEKDRVIIRTHDLVPRADLTVELFDDGPKHTGYVAVHGVDDELVAPDKLSEARKLAAQQQDYVLIPVQTSEIPRPAGGLDLVFIVDSSAATDPASMLLARQFVSSVLTHLGEQDRALVMAGDGQLREVLAGWNMLRPVTASLREEAQAALALIHRGGATDLGAMLSQAAMKLDPSRHSSVIYLGDGRPTVGELALADLQKRMEKLARPVRVFGFGLGDNADMSVIQGVTQGGFSERLQHSSEVAQAALRLLEHAEKPALLGVTLDLGPTLERAVPAKLGALVSGSTAWVVARINGELPAQVQIQSPYGKQSLPLITRKIADYGDLRYRWATLRMQQLLEKGAGRAELVELGTRNGLITPYTSLYVPTKSEIDPSQWEKLRHQQRSEQAFFLPSHPLIPQPQLTQHGWVDLLPILVGCSKGQKSYDSAEQKRELYQVVSEPMAAAPHANNSPAPELTASPNKSKDENDDQQPSQQRLGTAAHDDTARQQHAQPSEALAKQASGDKNKGQYHQPVPRGMRAGGKALSKQRSDAYGNKPSDALSKTTRETTSDTKATEPENELASTSDPSPTHEKQAIPSLEPTYERDVRESNNSSGNTFSTANKDTTASDRGASADTSGITINIAILPHTPKPCSPSAKQPLGQRMVLWAERLRQAAGDASKTAAVYRRAIALCEAPSWIERAQLLSMMLDALPQINDQVELWRLMQKTPKEADALYRGILSRIRSVQQMQKLHDIIGISTADPGVVQSLIEKTPNPSDLVIKLREMVQRWPDDTALALRLLHALEDAQDRDGVRNLADQLRNRPDADATVRMQVAELWLRLAKSEQNKPVAAQDEAQAHRTFGEIVEFSPDQPTARRLLGDLYRAHGWYAQAERQYQTLTQLIPNDSSVWLLQASAAQGQGKLDEAVRRIESVLSASSADDNQGLSRTARALAATYLAWARVDAQKEGKTDEIKLMRAKSQRLLAHQQNSASAVRVTLLWSHPLLYPVLYTDASGVMAPAIDGDVSLGITQAILPSDDNKAVEIRVDSVAARQAARLGLTAVLTVIFHEATDKEKVVILPVAFPSPQQQTVRFAVHRMQVTP